LNHQELGLIELNHFRVFEKFEFVFDVVEMILEYYCLERLKVVDVRHH
jgi:hypothetical protein